MGKYGMAGDHFFDSNYINLKYLPDANREYIESFDNLYGGINTLDAAFNLKSNEAAMCKNMTWRAGLLGSRRGQIAKYTLTGANSDGIIGCAQFLFHGWMMAYNDDGFWFIKMQETGEATVESAVGAKEFRAMLPFSGNHGTFFRYREFVFYKAHGIYVKISWNESTDALTPVHVVGSTVVDNGNGPETVYYSNAYIPIIQIDTDPATGSGTLYQQENRLTPFKRVSYIAKNSEDEYHLPVTNIDDVTRVENDGTLVPDTDYTVNTTDGTVTFAAGHIPLDDSEVTITYRKNNDEAIKSLLQSVTAAVFGGAQDLCVVMGGPPTQPNAFFWSGNNGTVMDPTYFPMNHYNLAGDNSDSITCFGKQQNMLVVFQTNATGRAVFGTETVNGLVEVTMNYTKINDQIGCDLPGSLQLVENNLVWASKKHGICRLKDCSAAYENNITIISRKIHNGRYGEYTGLFSHIKSISTSWVSSVDTGTRYLLCVRGATAHWFYEWNYEISKYENPSWFIHTNIEGVGFLSLENDQLIEITPDGVIAEFKDGTFYDECKYNAGKTAIVQEAIRKVYIFPPRNFGSYDRLKNIASCIFTTRADTDQHTDARYICDYGERLDPTPLDVTATGERWGRPYASVFRRKPGYSNIRHLQVRLFNNEIGKDLSIISLQIFYTFRGRQR